MNKILLSLYSKIEYITDYNDLNDMDQIGGGYVIQLRDSG